MLFLIHHCLRQTVGRSLEDRPTLLSSLRQPFQNPPCPLSSLCKEASLSLSLPPKDEKGGGWKEEKHAPPHSFPLSCRQKGAKGRREKEGSPARSVQSPKSRELDRDCNIYSVKKGRKPHIEGAAKRRSSDSSSFSSLEKRRTKKGFFFSGKKGTLFVFFRTRKRSPQTVVPLTGGRRGTKGGGGRGKGEKRKRLRGQDCNWKEGKGPRPSLFVSP